MTKSTKSSKPAKATKALQPVEKPALQRVGTKAGPLAPFPTRFDERQFPQTRGQASIEALLVTAAGLAFLALAAVAASVVQAALLQATVASAQVAALEKLSAASNEVTSFAPGSKTLVKLELLAQNTSFAYGDGTLSLRYWHNGKTRAVERKDNARVQIAGRNYSKGVWLAAVENTDGVAVVSIANPG